MRGFSLTFSGFAALTAVCALARAEETPAAPMRRTPPDYPAACMPPPGVKPDPQTVIVVYNVTKNGFAENVRVRETSDPCFNDTAVTTVRTWSFEPRRVSGDARDQEDIETTFTFLFEETTGIADFDARPLVRVPAHYPEKCSSTAAPREVVLVEFDVTAEGETDNVRVIDSTNRCLDGAATTSVKKWKYRPKTISGKPELRKSVQTKIVFELSNGGLSQEMRVRPAVRKKLKSIQDDISKGRDPEKVLAALAEIHEEYGSSFTKPELAGFQQLRGVARLAGKDYRGALDDLRMALRMGRTGEASEDLGKVVQQLEAIVAAQDAQSAAQQEAGSEAP